MALLNLIFFMQKLGIFVSALQKGKKKRRKYQEITNNTSVEEKFKIVLQHNFPEQEKIDEKILSKFEDIFIKTFSKRQQKSEAELSKQNLSKAEMIIEEIFAEHWPEYLLDLDYTNIDLEFLEIFKVHLYKINHQ